jgi:hypothetical protein
MEMKIGINLKYLLYSVLVPCVAIALFIGWLFMTDRVNGDFFRIMPNADWHGLLMEYEGLILESYSRKDYEDARYCLRKAKIWGNSGHRYSTKREYLLFIDSIRNQLPAEIDKSRLPFDLLDGNRGKILFNINNYQYPLHEKEHRTELNRMADDILSASRNAPDFVGAYWTDYFTVGGLSQEDVDIINERHPELAETIQDWRISR